MTYVSVHYTVCNQNQKMLVNFAKLKTSFHNVNLKLCLDIVWIVFFFFVVPYKYPPANNPASQNFETNRLWNKALRIGLDC